MEREAAEAMLILGTAGNYLLRKKEGNVVVSYVRVSRQSGHTKVVHILVSKKQGMWMDGTEVIAFEGQTVQEMADALVKSAVPDAPPLNIQDQTIDADDITEVAL